jgi:hypothetical protein
MEEKIKKLATKLGQIKTRLDKAKKELSGMHLIPPANCPICLGTFFSDDMYQCEVCKQSTCHDCMRNQILQSGRDLSTFPPKCSHCKSQFTEEITQNYLAQPQYADVLAKLQSAYIHEAVKCLRGKRYDCPHPKCGQPLFIEDDDLKEDTPYVCNHCDRMLCPTCRSSWHPGVTCVENQQKAPDELKKLAQEKAWKNCPACNILIEKTRDCNHMICRCGQHFCYLCGAKLQNHEPSSPCPTEGCVCKATHYSLTHPLFREEDLQAEDEAP